MLTHTHIQVYPTDTLPTLAVISPAGKPIMFHKGKMGDRYAFHDKVTKEYAYV